MAVQFSAIYHDVVKDRLYTDAANAPRRRATQTALHRMVQRLCQMVAPILAFTSEEVWEFLPGAPTRSVHTSLWEPSQDLRTDAERATWSTLFTLRERAMPELEKARQAKLIGKSLDAVLHFDLIAAESAMAQAHQEELRELTNVSGVFIHVAELAETAGVRVQVASELSWAKCERC